MVLDVLEDVVEEGVWKGVYIVYGFEEILEFLLLVLGLEVSFVVEVVKDLEK